KDRPFSTSKGALGLIVAGWVVLLLVNPSEIMLVKLLYGHGSMFRIIGLIGLITKLFDWCELLLFVVVLIYTVRFIKSRKRGN
ncbi:MAG: hypothetical protein J6B39_07765, partial [Lachnospiraceae bacterium]|nr:hypothetical protein [Lachnospiraceae bacterium]